MNTLPNGYKTYYKLFESALIDVCENMNFEPQILTESMRYSLLSGGKRIRPVLFLSMLDACGADFRDPKALTLAVAVECIHTYSLIHDDLPAMDNDDFRRGRLSNHKKFGEANAILAGDGLLSYAFDLLLSVAANGERYLNAARILSRAAGAEGMVSGQSLDIACTAGSFGEKELFAIYGRKTGALLSAPLEMAAEIAGINHDCCRELGKYFGILFQLTDDLLDETGEGEIVGKTLGKDRAEEKLTCVKVFGLGKSVSLADEYAELCRRSLDKFEGDAAFYLELVDYVRGRNR